MKGRSINGQKSKPSLPHCASTTHGVANPFFDDGVQIGCLEVVAALALGLLSSLTPFWEPKMVVSWRGAVRSQCWRPLPKGATTCQAKSHHETMTSTAETNHQGPAFRGNAIQARRKNACIKPPTHTAP